MSTANPPFYTGPDLSLPDADDFLHNPSTAATPASQAVGDTAESGTTDSKVVICLISYVLRLMLFIRSCLGNVSARLESSLR